ncbi:unnamed protein product [Alternaria alternata]
MALKQSQSHALNARDKRSAATLHYVQLLISQLDPSEVIEPFHPDYAIHKDTFSTKQELHPAVVFAPNCTESLAQIVSFVYSSKVNFHIRGQGFMSPSSQDVIISMLKFKSFEYDSVRKLATIGTGSTWVEVAESMKEADPQYSGCNSLLSVMFYGKYGCVMPNLDDVADRKIFKAWTEPNSKGKRIYKVITFTNNPDFRDTPRDSPTRDEGLLVALSTLGTTIKYEVRDKATALHKSIKAQYKPYYKNLFLHSGVILPDKAPEVDIRPDLKSRSNRSIRTKAKAEKITYNRKVNARVLNTPKKRKTSKKARGELKAKLHNLQAELAGLKRQKEKAKSKDRAAITRLVNKKQEEIDVINNKLDEL